MSCALCTNLRYVVERGEFWTLAINRNQNLLGKSMLVLNRHCERVAERTDEKWAALHPYIARTTAALDSLFAPDQYNLAFLIPRLASAPARSAPVRFTARVAW